jgi:hypothetical protein
MRYGSSAAQPCSHLTTIAEYWCQHPRWNLHYQGAPLSIYMRYDCRRNTILYIISYKEDDTIVQALRSILNLSSLFAAASPGPEKRSRMYLEDPFHLHSMISSLSFEAMKNHVSRFRRFMYHNVSLDLFPFFHPRLGCVEEKQR